jgi:hypothetical protein
MFTKARLLRAIGTALFFGLFQLGIVSAQEANTAGVEVLTRGPVHEAFAEPFDANAAPGPAVAKEPPPPIPEAPPEERPQGDNVQWIGGYWAWDADRSDFIWISGTYRNAPPGRQFVPGHWVNTNDGWRWVAGYWAPINQTDPQYVEQPPAPLETEPALPPPDDNSTYVPGYWRYQDSAFVWRPGFYTQFRPGRIWVSPRYEWTPAGYLFVDGYWDYPLEDRGLLFAPVWFNRPYWRTAGWYYRPYYSIALDALLDCLFWRPGWCHYYFGDFYGPGYARLGYRPWFGRGFDPLFNYYRWNHRGDGNWLASRHRTFNDRMAGRTALPPQTFAHQTAGNRMVVPLNQVNHTRVTRMTATQLNVQKANVQRTHELGQARVQRENGLTARNVNGLKATVHNGQSHALKVAPNSVSGAGVPRVLNNAATTSHSNGVPSVLPKTVTTPHVAAPHYTPKAATPRYTPQVAPHYTPPVATPHVTQHAAPRVVNHAPAHAAPPAHVRSSYHASPSRGVSHAAHAAPSRSGGHAAHSGGGGGNHGRH